MTHPQSNYRAGRGLPSAIPRTTPMPGSAPGRGGSELIQQFNNATGRGRADASFPATADHIHEPRAHPRRSDADWWKANEGKQPECNKPRPKNTVVIPPKDPGGI